MLKEILVRLQSNYIGLCEDGSVGDFLDFRMGTILPSF